MRARQVWPTFFREARARDESERDFVVLRARDFGIAAGRGDAAEFTDDLANRIRRERSLQTHQFSGLRWTRGSKRNLQTHDEVKLVHEDAMQGVDVVRRDVDHRDATAGSFLERVGAEIGFCVFNLHGCIQRAGSVSVVPFTIGISQE